MKKIVIPLFVVALTLACVVPNIPGFPAPATNTPPSVGQTPAVPSATITAPVTQTSSPVVVSPIPQNSDTPTSSAVPDLTTTLATATSGSVDSSFTATATAVAGQATFTPTLGILTYGTLPPEVPYTTLIIVNRSKAQAYISLQVTLNDGRYSIIEYPVAGRVKIKAPVGSYIYVAWVGGKKMVGAFRLHASEQPTIILYKDKVVIQ